MPVPAMFAQILSRCHFHATVPDPARIEEEPSALLSRAAVKGPRFPTAEGACYRE